MPHVLVGIDVCVREDTLQREIRGLRACVATYLAQGDVYFTILAIGDKTQWLVQKHRGRYLDLDMIAHDLVEISKTTTMRDLIGAYKWSFGEGLDLAFLFVDGPHTAGGGAADVLASCGFLRGNGKGDIRTKVRIFVNAPFAEDVATIRELAHHENDLVRIGFPPSCDVTERTPADE